MFAVEPHVLSNPSSTTAEFLKGLTGEAGPVFITLEGHLLGLIDAIRPIGLKPLPQSASADAIFVCDAVGGSDSITLTCGLAMKNFAPGSTLSFSPLFEECALLDRKFTNSSGTHRRNILLVCCTKYSAKLSKRFTGKDHSVFDAPSCADIHEVILLNSTTKSRRGAFFACGGGAHEMH